MSAIEKLKKRQRRNLKNEFERLMFYLETIIRIKADDDNVSDHTAGQLKAYRDIQNYIGGGK